MDTRDPNESGSSSSASENYDGIGPKSYSYDELAKVTGHFSHNNLIGRGGFGHVFRASLDGETRAIKRLDYPGVESEGDLEREIMVVKSISHKNLVELIGYCIDGANRLLILKYFPNGSLRSKLDGKENVLDWKKRMNIAIGSARGLEYLHEHCKHKIIHLDIKPDNILLDEHFEPKITDFGLAHFFTDAATHISKSSVMGTQVYEDPLTTKLGKYSDKSDIYSFGVTLLELITGRKPLDNGIDIVTWANLHIREALDGKYANFVDSKIQSFDDEEMHRMVSCINSCLNRLPKFRPTMEKIRLVLEGKSLPEVLYDHNLQCGMIYKDENTIGPKSYSYGELARVTDHFSLNNQIGRGSFGHVFKASLDGEIRAIKRLDFPDVQFEEGLEREIMVFKSVRHKNLVELVGYCIHGSNRLLISKYFPNGSLRSKLHGSGDVLDWKKRMKIAIGSAKGLEYLHEHYFGLAQFFTDGATHISKSSVMGTHVYEDPLTTKLGKYSDKSDIYSFGVTLLELIMGRKPIENGIDIVTWANRLIKEEGRYTNFVDFNLQSFDREQMYRMISCVNSCLNQSPNSRPTMKKEADEPKPSLKPFIMEETNNYGIRDRGHASRRPTEATSYGSSHIIPETSFDEMNMLHLIKTLNISSYF
ncbi:proline-rich receptor-like protein kinase PERK3 isoform X3 [Manihot esculenta]|uniref:proline-rich receptor-like protein kinase PERK3 isoform X3 n=1 Tax=Manihot esculenta TaxID=3983 RepID=UPI001CC82D97|nr:proline-rich receptor-like protein kinase PERK3 isoform X3 [Manihot esculenta]